MAEQGSNELISVLGCGFAVHCSVAMRYVAHLAPALCAAATDA
jgi:hypothetical protein